MSSALKQTLGAILAVLLGACASPRQVTAVDEPENILQVGTPAPVNEVAVLAPPAPVVAIPVFVAPPPAPVAPLPAVAVPAPPALVVEIAPPAPRPKSSDLRNSYRLRPRDFIRMLIINEPDTQIERRINSDGTADFPILGQLIPIAGLTISEAQDEIARHARRIYKKPQVVISILTYAERRVYISGYVGKPGPVAIPPEESLTLNRAISMGGGILPRGNRSEVVIKRTAPDGSIQVIQKDVRKIDSGAEPDFVLEDEDQIYVEDRRF